MKRIKWEDAATAALAEILECSRGDAQGVMEANAARVNALFLAGVAPAAAAKQIANR